MEMAKVAGNLKTLALGCRTSMSAIAEVISQCDNLESFECLAVTANVPALWNESKPMRLRRLVLAATEYSSFQSVRLVRFGLPRQMNIFSLTPPFSKDYWNNCRSCVN